MLTKEELKEIFIEKHNVLTPEQFERLFSVSERTREPIEALLVAKNYVTDRFALEAISQYLKIDWVDLEKEAVAPGMLELIPEKFARTNQVIPFGKMGGEVLLAIAAYDLKTIEQVEKITSLKVRPHLASPYAIKKALFGYRVSIEEEIKNIIKAELKKLPAKEASVEAISPILDAVIEYAVWANASDIHIETMEDEVVVRYRIDGMLRDVVFLPKNLQAGIIARVKILSDLKIDEHRVPQDGRFTLKIEKEGVDFRVSIVPTIFGEKIAMRILVKSARLSALRELGFSPDDLETIGRNIQKPYGMILVTGPTGSGKTTTLYSMLHTIAENKVSIVNISTIEDPIEYVVRRINQIQIQPEVGLTFAVGVRAILRQDPDIVMIGEIRDLETARAGIQATLIGRLILSSLHTNDAPGAAVRLLDIGIEPYLVSSTLSLVIAQRLVRRVCKICLVSTPAKESDFRKLKKVFDLPSTITILQKRGILSKTDDPLKMVRFYKGKGCYACGGTGYRGRVGIFEALEVSPQLRHLISKRADAIMIREQAIQDGMITMFQDGFGKAILGLTTLEEVFRATVA